MIAENAVVANIDGKQTSLIGQQVFNPTTTVGKIELQMVVITAEKGLLDAA